MQKCPLCSPAKNTNSDILVDLTTQLLLDDITSGSRNVKDRLITLTCGHTFTVQALDHHCGMREYYKVSQIGRFFAPKSPSITFQKSPTCPTCYGPITALRYGRITKRAAMDILEQNVARVTSTAIDELTLSVSGHASKLSEYQRQARVITTHTTSHAEGATLDKLNISKSLTKNGPLPETAFDLGAMQSVHGLTVQEARIWHHVVKDIVNTYQRVLKLANARGPHIDVYEAALATFLRIETQEGDRIRVSDPIAQATVDHKIGQSRPQADLPFRVEAYFLTLELRSLLVKITQSRIEGLSKTYGDINTARHRASWTSFVSFVYDSCIADAEKAAALAKACPTPRYVTRAAVLKLQFAFNGLRWKTMSEYSELLRSGALDGTARARLSQRATDYKGELMQSLKQIQVSHLCTQLRQAEENLMDERKWLVENCDAKVKVLERECARLEEAFADRAGVDRQASVRAEETTVVRREPTSDKSTGCIVA